MELHYPRDGAGRRTQMRVQMVTPPPLVSGNRDHGSNPAPNCQEIIEGAIIARSAAYSSRWRSRAYSAKLRCSEAPLSPGSPDTLGIGTHSECPEGRSCSTGRSSPAQGGSRAEGWDSIASVSRYTLLFVALWMLTFLYSSVGKNGTRHRQRERAV